MRYLPYFSTIITFLFMIAVFRRYQQRRGAHLLLWGIGLLFYGLGTLGEVILGLTYHPWVLKLWYLSGAMLTAAWLGTGTLHLLIRKPSIPRGFTWLIGILSLLSLILLAAAPVTDAPYDVQRLASEQYKEILVRNGWIIFLTIFLNIYGTITLVGGAIYSAFAFWRKRVLVYRMLGNILIAAGALSPALGGTFLRAGHGDWLYLSELIGAILMYIGFVLAVKDRPQ
ncbi:MAG: hypothetical protein WHS87_11715 [Anaerolineales bacterium]